MNSSLIQIAATVPRLLVLAGVIAALAFAIARRRTLGRAAMPAIAGSSLLLVSAAYDVAVVMIMYFGYFHHSLLPMGDYVAIQALINAVSGLLWAAGMALVIAAVFIGRKSVTPAPDQPCPPVGPLP